MISFLLCSFGYKPIYVLARVATPSFKLKHMQCSLPESEGNITSLVLQEVIRLIPGFCDEGIDLVEVTSKVHTFFFQYLSREGIFKNIEEDLTPREYWMRAEMLGASKVLCAMMRFVVALPCSSAATERQNSVAARLQTRGPRYKVSNMSKVTVFY